MPCVHRSAALLATFLFVAPLAAQEAAPAVESRQALAAPFAARQVDAPAVTASLASLAPTPEHARAGVQAALVQPAPAPALLPRRGDSSRNRALMIVGGATLLVGAVVSGSNSDAGTIIMIGGGAIGLYGLYRYLQ